MEILSEYIPKFVLDATRGGDRETGFYRISNVNRFTKIYLHDNILACIDYQYDIPIYYKVSYLNFKVKHENYLNYLEDGCAIRIERLSVQIFKILLNYDLSRCEVIIKASSLESFLSFSNGYGKLTVDKLTLVDHFYITHRNLDISNISCNILKIHSNSTRDQKFHGTNSEVFIIHGEIVADFTNVICRMNGYYPNTVVNVNEQHPLYNEATKELIEKQDIKNLVKYYIETKFRKTKSARNGST